MHPQTRSECYRPRHRPCRCAAPDERAAPCRTPHPCETHRRVDRARDRLGVLRRHNLVGPAARVALPPAAAARHAPAAALPGPRRGAAVRVPAPAARAPCVQPTRRGGHAPGRCGRRDGAERGRVDGRRAWGRYAPREEAAGREAAGGTDVPRAGLGQHAPGAFFFFSFSFSFSFSISLPFYFILLYRVSIPLR